MKKGFKRHGLSLNITSNINEPGDIHIVSGPHYAKYRWIGSPAILLDRAYYKTGPKPVGMFSMPCVSLGWLRPDGGRYFIEGFGREPPVIKEPKTTGGTIFLADYDGPIEMADEIRFHPANKNSNESLLDVLRRHKTAIGYQTTALVTAALEGLSIICKDPRNIMYESNWLNLIPYADWHYTEIESGEAIDYLWFQCQQ